MTPVVVMEVVVAHRKFILFFLSNFNLSVEINEQIFRARKRSFRDGERNLRGFSNALDNRFEGNQTYDKTVRPYMHEKYHDYSAEKNCEKKDWEAARNDKFNAERHYRTRHDIPQSYDEHGKFKKEEYITERQERENQEKYGKK